MSDKQLDMRLATKRERYRANILKELFESRCELQRRLAKHGEGCELSKSCKLVVETLESRLRLLDEQDEEACRGRTRKPGEAPLAGSLGGTIAGKKE